MSNHPPDYDPNRQGQYPPWSQDDHAPYPVCGPVRWQLQSDGLLTSQYPASYPPPPDDRAYYPASQYPPPSNMAAIHPHAQGQDPYRLPPPPGSYRPDVYGQPPPQVVYQAAAPRQRTAIACRYCRRRKVRVGHNLLAWGILHEGILHGGHVRLLTSALDPLLGIRKLAGWPVQQLHSF